ncbi:ABC transporter permease [Streptomyces atratus]|uniref:ABC transporter permease n=1 Tax=Streptomyces atratus TaxID=1893 RepID=UPI003245BBB0
MPAPESTAFAAGLDTLEAQQVPAARRWPRRTAAQAAPPLLAVTLVLALWQAAYLLGFSDTLPAPAEVADDLGAAWRAGTLLPALGHSLARCLFGFMASAVIGTLLGLLLARIGPLRTTVGPVLGALQSLPAAALVPVAVIALGESESAVYAVVLLGAVPSIAVGILSAVRQIPPQLLRAARTMGATGRATATHILLPAALPGCVVALKQGWTFGWRALMTAELITSTQLPGIGRMLDEGRNQHDFSLVLAAVVLILALGTAIDVGVFGPLERRVLSHRGLAPDTMSA